MEKETQIEDLTISDEQAETIAYNIFRDIGEYINQNISRFLIWMVEEEINSYKFFCISLDDGITVITKDNKKQNYKYV